MAPGQIAFEPELATVEGDCLSIFLDKIRNYPYILLLTESLPLGPNRDG
jgi:hypothetical protein